MVGAPALEARAVAAVSTPTAAQSRPLLDRAPLSPGGDQQSCGWNQVARRERSQNAVADDQLERCQTRARAAESGLASSSIREQAVGLGENIIEFVALGSGDLAFAPSQQS